MSMFFVIVLTTFQVREGTEKQTKNVEDEFHVSLIFFFVVVFA